MQETIYVGLDLGSSVCQQTVMSRDGVRRYSRSFATSEMSQRTAFDKLEGDVRVVWKRLNWPIGRRRSSFSRYPRRPKAARNDW